MMRWLRRLFVLSVLVGVGLGGCQVCNRSRNAPSSTPEWPPLRTDTPKPDTAPAAATDESATSEAATWKAPVDGKCPDGYPLKANDNSGIFHSPGGRFYDRTVAERCYARAEDAIADGYRPAKA